MNNNIINNFIINVSEFLFLFEDDANSLTFIAETFQGRNYKLVGRGQDWVINPGGCKTLLNLSCVYP